MQSLNRFLPLVLLIAVSHPGLAEEGEIFQNRHGCTIELADGSEKTIECPPSGRVPKIMDADEKLSSILKLGTFENSNAMSIANQASSEMRSNKDFDSRKYSSHVVQQAQKVDDGKFLVRIVFPNDGGYPHKGTSNKKYYLSSESDYYQVLDDDQQAKWDNLIKIAKLGEYYADYQPSVEAVTPENVIITVTLDESSQLNEIIEGQEVRTIDHAGMPEVVYGEIEPSLAPAKN